MKKGIKKGSWFGWFILMVILIGSAKYISENHYQLMLIQGKSMEPTYHHLQFVILDKQKKEYDYNDVIAFWCDSLNTYLVKRVIACPGDWVCINDGILYINGHANEHYREMRIDFSGIAGKEIMLPENCYFVLGDNVSESKDSRYEEVGFVKQDTILGKVMK